MKKIFLISILFISIIPISALAAGPLVTCGGNGQPACTFSDLLGLIPKIIDFLIKFIVAPLATFFLIVGGVVLLVSAGNPNLASMGKSIMKTAIIGLFLALCAWLIINTILLAFGAPGLGG